LILESRTQGEWPPASDSGEFAALTFMTKAGGAPRAPALFANSLSGGLHALGGLFDKRCDSLGL
jgi:hypothetical protein